MDSDVLEFVVVVAEEVVDDALELVDWLPGVDSGAPMSC